MLAEGPGLAVARPLVGERISGCVKDHWAWWSLSVQGMVEAEGFVPELLRIT